MTLVIPNRFNGPPASGQGGYSAGLLVERLDAPAAEVALRLPPPLDRALEVRARQDGALAAVDGDDVVLEARPLARLDVDAPAPVAPDDAAAAAERSAWSDDHPYPTCFACGPERAPGDGLRLFPGPVRDDLHAAAWTPAAELAGADGEIPMRYVWAALDCPTVSPVLVPRPAARLVLARLAVERRAPVRAGEPYAIGTWSLGIDGRKRRAAGALWDADGAVVAVTEALWIQLRA